MGPFCFAAIATGVTSKVFQPAGTSQEWSYDKMMVEMGVNGHFLHCLHCNYKMTHMKLLHTS